MSSASGQHNMYSPLSLVAQCTIRLIYYPTRDIARGLSDWFTLSVCLPVSSFDICRLHGRGRTLYRPTPETITAEGHLVLSVDGNGLPRNCHLSWYFLCVCVCVCVLIVDGCKGVKGV